MSNRWFRYYDDALDDPKVQRLSHHLFRAWVNLLCIASKNDGVLPPMVDLPFKLRMSELDAQQAVEDLIVAGLVDIRPDGKMEPHNWAVRQFASDSSKERTRKWRNRKAKKAGDVTVTASDEKCDGIESYSYTETNIDTLGLPSSHPLATRSRANDQGIKSIFSKGREDGRKDKVVSRAEGLGIPVDDLIEAVNRHKAKNRSAYFTTLCVQWLQAKLPGLEEQIIRDALWDKNNQYRVVVGLLTEAA